MGEGGPTATSQSWWAARVAAMLAELDLEPLAGRSAQALSGGEQRRLALGRVLIQDPRILLLDEPAAHLDRASQRVIERILGETQATLILATHDLHRAHRLASRVLTLSAGRIAPGLPENILGGERRGGLLRTAGGLEIALPPELPAGAAEDSRLVVMIDPRSLVLSPEPLTSSMRNRISGEVCSVRTEGGNVWVEVDCGERLTAIISRASYQELGINLHRQVVVSFKANAVEVL